MATKASISTAMALWKKKLDKSQDIEYKEIKEKHHGQEILYAIYLIRCKQYEGMG
jgi:hypothetical protein